MTDCTPPRLRTIDSSIPRDLETIVHKAIERDASHRYQSSGEFASDLERFLRDEPIRARWASPLTRFRRWCKRSPLGATLALLVTALAIGGPIVAANQLQLKNEASAAAGDARQQEAKAVRQREIAVANEAEAARQRERAEENLRQARTAVDRLFTKAAIDLEGKPHMEEVRRELLEDALEFYQQFMEQKGEDVTIREETGLAYMRVSSIKRLLGQPEVAVAPAREAVSLFKGLLWESPDNLGYEQRLGEAYGTLGIALFSSGRFEEAAETTERKIVLWDGLSKRYPADVGYRRQCRVRPLRSCESADLDSGPIWGGGNPLSNLTEALAATEEGRPPAGFPSGRRSACPSLAGQYADETGPIPGSRAAPCRQRRTSSANARRTSRQCEAETLAGACPDLSWQLSAASRKGG